MFPIPFNRYAEWRGEHGLPAELREKDGRPPERLLQSIWYHQRIHRDQLVTLDGEPMRVLHPGFWNHEAGPDFRQAIIQLDGKTPILGDIEIDFCPGDWHAHRHDSNPGYRNVVLHVVWEAAEKSPRRTLALQPALDSPLDELARWLGSEAARSFPIDLLGRCCAPLRGLKATALSELLRQAAWVRLQAKAGQLQARARQAGWEQALWEGVFRALGYKQNLWPMQRLGELRPRLCREMKRAKALSLQARLLGVAGMLPGELSRLQTGQHEYVRQLWDVWWRERDEFQDCLLPPSLWKFSGIRPANHPQRRLALAAHWLAAGDLPARLERWCLSPDDSVCQAAALLDALRVPEDEFWSRHWTLRSKPFSPPQPLLGATRVTDLAVNVILPWLWVRAIEGRNEKLRREIENLFFTWPPAGDNSVLRLARQRLLGGTSVKPLNTAAAQQGLLQIVKDFCGHSNSLCAECRFPALVSQWPGS